MVIVNCISCSFELRPRRDELARLCAENQARVQTQVIRCRGRSKSSDRRICPEYDTCAACATTIIYCGIEFPGTILRQVFLASYCCMTDDHTHSDGPHSVAELGDTLSNRIIPRGWLLNRSVAGSDSLHGDLATHWPHSPQAAGVRFILSTFFTPQRPQSQ